MEAVSTPSVPTCRARIEAHRARAVDLGFGVHLSGERVREPAAERTSGEVVAVGALEGVVLADRANLEGVLVQTAARSVGPE